ncbi:MAG: stage III sporulation protein AG [Clostridiaceae bacterium]|mgnify:CR=1 FL=1|jgi:stage III sporulation protein AG|nr:stage III sporulation protein AG [Clostridiaceae bacterium]
MPKWYERMKEYLQEKKGKRGIENLVIFLILGVIIIIVASSFFSEGEKQKKDAEAIQTIKLTSNKPVDELQDFEKRLEQILSEIEGAGNVKVMVTGDSDGEVVHAYNDSEESKLQEEQNDTGIRSQSNEKRVERELVFMDGETGGRVPVVTQKFKPEVKGVVVVADGAGSSTVRQNILNAVEALTGIPTHRIQVLKRK